jgi:hypothetical protein
MSLAAAAGAFRRGLAKDLPPPPFREFCERELGLELSPILASVMDAADGLPVTTIDDDTAMRIFGCQRDALPRRRHRVLALLAGGRGGKTSRFAAPLAIYSAKYVPTPTLRRGEYARALAMAPDKDLARQIIDYCRGYIAESRQLCSMLADPPPLDDRDEIDESKIGALERIALRRPNGQLVEIAVKAAGRGGVGARSRTLVCALLDEASFFRAKGTGVINDQEIYRAAIQRVVPAGRLLLSSTAWVENQGVLEEKIRDNWGKHDSALVARAGTRDLNPTWDPDGSIEADMRKTDPENAAREIDTQSMAAGAETFYPEDAITKTFVRAAESLEPDRAFRHGASVDMGYRKNSSAISIAREERGLIRLAFRLELRPERGLSLKPSVVTREFAFWCMRYGAPAMLGDRHSVDATIEELGKLERALRSPKEADAEQRAWVERVLADPYARTAKVPTYIEWPSKENADPDIRTAHHNNADAHTEMRRRMQEGLVELPADDRMKKQCRETRKKPGEAGHVQIVLPKDGLAHGDLWGSVVIVCTELSLQAPPPPPPPPQADPLIDWRTAGRGFR